MTKENTVQDRKEFLLAKIRAGRTQIQDQYLLPKKTVSSSQHPWLTDSLPKLLGLASRYPALIAGLGVATIVFLPRRSNKKTRRQAETDFAPAQFTRLTLALKALPYLMPLVSRALQSMQTIKNTRNKYQ